MRTSMNIFAIALLLIISSCKPKKVMDEFKPFTPPVSYEEADKKADSLIKIMTTDEKIQLIGGHNLFFIKGFEKYHIPQLYLSDATS